MKKPLAELIPLLARGMAPTAAVASTLLAPMALGASGDLDPDFAAVGRLGPILHLDGPSWSLEALNSDEITFAGGDFDDVCNDWYCYYEQYYEATNFVSRASAAGSIDLTFDAERLARSQVMDIALQPDGKVVAVGRRVGSRLPSSQLIVFRLEREGPLDPTFGTGGIVELSTDDHGLHHEGTSVVLDPDGRIVVAGIRDSALIVLRLLADGSLDQSFGTSGIFVGPANFNDASTRILRTADGGYRVSISSESCQVIALTAVGAVDSAFGASGVASVEPPSSSCTSLVAQSDGRLLVAGIGADHGFATRLLVNGQIDPGFAAGAIASAMADATALAVGDDGSVVVAGHAAGVEGALIMRLQANGELDSLFGQAGSTLIDLPSDDGSFPVVHDMAVKPDGSVIAAGGDYRSAMPHPFVVRLVGFSAEESPGVLGISFPSADAAEKDQEVVVNVRRTGGSSGSISVAYQTAPADGSATSGQDYAEVSGRLTWDDGEMSEREIAVPIHDNAGSPEEYELFRVALSDAQGGAGIGTRNATINILPDGAPAGQFALEIYGNTVSEFEIVQAWVSRNYYLDGAVSVTLTPVARTAAAGDDFDAMPVTLSWADQESGAKLVEIPIRDDSRREADEIFTVELSNPAGGAIIGPRSSATITIAANDQPIPPVPGRGGGGGGGGSSGWLSLLLLGLAELFRTIRRFRPGRA